MRRSALNILAVTAIAAALMLSSSTTLAQGMPKSNQFWWPDQLDLSPLRAHGAESDPMGDDFDYAAAFATDRKSVV